MPPHLAHRDGVHRHHSELTRISAKRVTRSAATRLLTGLNVSDPPFQGQSDTNSQSTTLPQRGSVSHLAAGLSRSYHLAAGLSLSPHLQLGFPCRLTLQQPSLKSDIIYATATAIMTHKIIHFSHFGIINGIKVFGTPLAIRKDVREKQKPKAPDKGRRPSQAVQRHY